VTDDAKKRAWLGQLMDEYGATLEAWLYRRTGNHADACELTQETFLRMWQVKDIAEILEPKAYMFTIARHLADHLGSRRGRTEGSLEASDPKLEKELSHHPDFVGEIADEETLAKVREAFAELRPELRAAWHLKHGHGLTYEEIARHLGVSKDTVKKYLQQVILHIQKRLGLKDDE
jgi:RNA polymerase sigma-70 factor (ECF subfamily)